MGSGEGNFSRVLVTKGTYTATEQIDLDDHSVEVFVGLGQTSIIDLDYLGVTATPMIKCGADMIEFGNLSIISSFTQTVNDFYVVELYDNITAIADRINISGCNDKGYGIRQGLNLSNSNITETYHGCNSVGNISNVYTDTAYAGFVSCTFLRGVRATGASRAGFWGCSSISSGYALSNTGHGFESCTYVSASYASANTSSGFYLGNSITGCYAMGNLSRGFESILNVTGCHAISNKYAGIKSCQYISSTNF